MKYPSLAAIAFAISPAAFAWQATILSDVSIYSVKSTQGGTEYLTPSMSSTERNHAGEVMHITTEEVGFANNARALLHGRFLNEIKTVPLCDIQGRPSPCKSGGKLVGFRRTWDASGHKVGKFEYVVIPNRLSGLRQVGLLVK